MKVKKPFALREGDKISLIAPSSPFFRAAFSTGMDELKRYKLVPVFREDLFQRDGYLAGSDSRRVDELMEAFTSDSAAIMAVRGGYGSIRLLPELKKRFSADIWPKIFVGFSDVCFLHGFLFNMGWVTVHGPMLAFGFGGEGDFRSRARLMDMLYGGEAESLKGTKAYGDSVVKGKVYGGNLSIIISSIGTPAHVPLEGKILLLEDWNEPLYRVDRMLQQMVQSGELNGVKGIGFGLVGLRNENDAAYTEQFINMALNTLSPLKIPVVFGLPFGHGRVNHPFPMGVEAELDPEAAEIRFLERPFLSPGEEDEQG